MGKFSSLLKVYERLNESIKTYRSRTEIGKIKAIFGALGLGISAGLATLIQFFFNQTTVTTLFWLITSGISIPLFSLFAERYWDKREKFLRNQKGVVYQIKLEKERYYEEINDIQTLGLSSTETNKLKLKAFNNHQENLQRIRESAKNDIENEPRYYIPYPQKALKEADEVLVKVYNPAELKQIEENMDDNKSKIAEIKRRIERNKVTN